MAQHWLVVPSEAALERAEATITQARPRETAAVETHLCHLHATRFKTPDVAHEVLAALASAGRTTRSTPTA